MISNLLAPGDPEYPERLSDLKNKGPDGEVGPPPTLYVRGAIPAMPGVAVVGTRDATEEALSFARRLARELCEAGLCVWSGGALGVDAAAHEGALEGGGATVVVMGGGLAQPYPRENIPLFDRVLASGGALVARVEDDTPPLPGLFLRRNEILAAATEATVVVLAGVQSGARSTAAAARRVGRLLLVVPQAPWDTRGAGCALELTLGARAITRAADVLAALGREPPPAQRAPPSKRQRAGGSRRKGEDDKQSAQLALDDAPIKLQRGRLKGEARLSSAHEVGELTLPTPDERAVVEALSDLPMHVDEVCDKAALPLRRALGALLTLTLQAVVVEGPAGFFRRVRR